MFQLILRIVLRTLLRLYHVAYLAVSHVTGVSRRRSRNKVEILCTGSFYSENWVRAHLDPMAGAENCSVVSVVSTYAITGGTKLRVIHPPSLLVRVIGAVPARLIVFAWAAIRYRPDIIGGFHLLFNGMIAILLARLVGARALYLCVGGPTETLYGGQSENRLFGKLKDPDRTITDLLIRIVSYADIVVTMGAGAAEYFRTRGVKTRVIVIPGGTDQAKFYPSGENPDLDVILVARLAAVKQIDVFLKAIKITASSLPDIKVLVVGGGPLRRPLEELASELGIAHLVTFAGQVDDVSSMLRRAKVFALTSASEGVALSMLEAMMCGLPVVVPKVGDLADFVRDTENGFLISGGRPEEFAARIRLLLEDEGTRRAFGQCARQSVLRLGVGTVSRTWENLLASH